MSLIFLIKWRGEGEADVSAAFDIELDFFLIRQ